jgi:uncharacterized OB-fold protein
MDKKRVFISDDICRMDENGKYHLYGSVCKKCGHISYPATSFCTSCLSKDQELYDLSEEGEIYSYTITRVHPPYGHFPIPHPIAYISIPKSKARVTAPLFPEDEPEYKIGAKVKMEFATYWEEEDKVVIGPKYRIIKEGDNPDA